MVERRITLDKEAGIKEQKVLTMREIECEQSGRRISG